MEQFGERPVWSMSGGEMLSTLDWLDVELARLETLAIWGELPSTPHRPRDTPAPSDPWGDPTTSTPQLTR